MFFGLGPQIGLNLPSKKFRGLKMVNPKVYCFGKTAASDYRGLDWGANGLAGLRFKMASSSLLTILFGLRNVIPVPTGDDKLRNAVLGFRLATSSPTAPKKQKPKEERKIIKLIIQWKAPLHWGLFVLIHPAEPVILPASWNMVCNHWTGLKHFIYMSTSHLSEQEQLQPGKLAELIMMGIEFTWPLFPVNALISE